jgi:hypothetical protein
MKKALGSFLAQRSTEDMMIRRDIESAAVN